MSGFGDEEVELATATLMRAARGAYARSMRAALQEIEVDDLPRNGALILAGIDNYGGPRQDLPADLGVTKQAVSQVVDTLVSRGYLIRSTDQDDRRRINLELTERGREVVDAIRRGIDAVDVRLRERTSAEVVEAMRTGLSILADIKSADIAAGVGQPRPRQTPQLRRFCPIFPVRDVPAALAHYAALGFRTESYDAGYGFASRDGVELHLTGRDDYDHHHEDEQDPGHEQHDHHESGHEHEGGRAYLFVRDADALYEEWSTAGIGGQTWPVELKPWKVREGSHTDPDGNVIRFGSFVKE
jgi:DNA-binding MarR family transcriptional regulator